MLHKDIDPIDRMPVINYDEKELIKLFEREKTEIDQARSQWYLRKLEFLYQWDDFIQYKHDSVISDQPYIHIPVTFEKIQTWHSRMYKTITSMDPLFHMEPLNLASKEEVEATKMILRWYLRDEINYRQGMKPVIDELLWDLGTDGWGCIYKRWEKLHRMIVDMERVEVSNLREEVREVGEEIRKKGRPRKSYKEYREIPKIIEIFSGVVLETLPHECVYFPANIPTSGDLNHPEIIMIELLKTEQELILMKEQGFYDAEAVDEVIKKGKGYDNALKQDLREQRHRLVGIDSEQRNYEKEFPIDVIFFRKDLDEDGFPEEYVFSASIKARKVLRATYLDRICRDHNRPIYKFDLIKRPRSSYSRGFPEILYSLNTEIDDFHNIRRASGLIANVPWGFYRASSGLEKEAIEVAPGKFYPVDDPQTDVKPMNFPNVTSWALQEEGLAQTYADKLTSMPALLQGQVAGPIGPLRSTSGMLSLIQESQAPLDVYLDRFRGPFGKLMSGILSDLQARLPEIVKIKVLGEKGELLYGTDGQMLFMEIPKHLYSGQYKFTLAANDAQYNPERDRQNALAIAQMLMTQFPIQAGIVSPQNAYNIYKNILEKNGVLDVDSYLTKPPMIPSPMNLLQEYTAIINGRVPMIVMNDNHAEKITGLTALINSSEYQEGKTLGTVHPLADLIMSQVLQTHQAYLQLIAQMPAMQNQSGLEMPLTIGGRQAGVGPTRVEEETSGPVPETMVPIRGGNRNEQTGSAQSTVPSA